MSEKYEEAVLHELADADSQGLDEVIVNCHKRLDALGVAQGRRSAVIRKRRAQAAAAKVEPERRPDVHKVPPRDRTARRPEQKG